MSSDTFTIEVTKIDQDQVEFLCHTGTAAGLNDYAITRSFALTIIEDGMPYASDGKGTPLQLELIKLAGREPPPLWDSDFHKNHVANFIVNTKLVKRIGIIKDEEAWKEGRFGFENYADHPLHRFVIHAQVTDPKWLIGLTEGSSYGTTAFDAWWQDPTRQSDAELAEIERKASKWKRPTKKRSPKSTNVDGTDQPAPAKKSAAKKT